MIDEIVRKIYEEDERYSFTYTWYALIQYMYMCIHPVHPVHVHVHSSSTCTCAFVQYIQYMYMCIHPVHPVHVHVHSSSTSSSFTCAWYAFYGSPTRHSLSRSCSSSRARSIGDMSAITAGVLILKKFHKMISLESLLETLLVITSCMQLHIVIVWWWFASCFNIHMDYF